MFLGSCAVVVFVSVAARRNTNKTPTMASIQRYSLNDQALHLLFVGIFSQFVLMMTTSKPSFNEEIGIYSSML
jgi:hypothetical protein